jgi:hypothetical protein
MGRHRGGLGDSAAHNASAENRDFHAIATREGAAAASGGGCAIQPLDDRCGPKATPAAHCLQTVSEIPTLKFVEEVTHQASARSAKRMSD